MRIRLAGCSSCRAMALLPADGAQPEPPVLLIIGDDSHNGASESRLSGGERVRLEALADSLGISKQVRFLGSVDQPALAGYLSLASVCVVPSYSESFGLVALEAAACGTPVVGIRGSNLDWIILHEQGSWAMENTPVALADAIEQFSGKDLKAVGAAAASRAAERHAWPCVFERLFCIYREVCANYTRH